MPRIVVAFPERETTRKVAAVLETGGYQVFRTCLTGNEVMRAFTLCQDGLLICGARFPDRSADDLAWDLGDAAVILVIARPEQLEQCEHPRLFRRAVPLNRSELLSAVDMLVQLHDHGMPRREGEQKELVRRAKDSLQEKYGVTEPEAHHAMQKYAMSHGMKMAECARKVLEGKIQLSEF